MLLPVFDLSFPSLHFKYFGVTTFELICLAGWKFFRVRSLASCELCLLVVVFGEINLTGSYGLPPVIRIIFWESPRSSGFDSLLLSSLIRISMAKSMLLSILSGLLPPFFAVVLWI